MTLLYLDFDGALPPTVCAFVAECCRLWRWPVDGMRFDRTRRGWHVVVRVRKRLDFTAVVGAQAIMGSDARREMHNLMRAEAIRRGEVSAWWAKRANVLYQRHTRGLKLGAV